MTGAPIRSRRRATHAALVTALGLAAAVPATAAAAAAPNAYKQKNLVSDQPGRATITDPNLVNPWGLAAGPTTPLWVSDNGTDLATVYGGAIGGAPPSIVPLVVKIPGGAPTGQVFNGSSAFGGASFIFSSLSGRITAWTNGTSAVSKVKRAGAAYTGLAISGHRLYAADFHHRRVDVFDGKFHRAKHPGFADKKVPKSYGPFGIQAIGSRIYVSYAKQDLYSMGDAAGPGRGFVDVFSTKGKLVRRLIKRGHLDSPWGLVVAPKGFGAFGRDLLVGNFGNGAINAYDRKGHFRGRLRVSPGHPLAIDGLWGLRFGNGTFAAKNALVFSAGPDGESHGLLGTITAG